MYPIRQDKPPHSIRGGLPVLVATQLEGLSAIVHAEIACGRRSLAACRRKAKSFPTVRNFGWCVEFVGGHVPALAENRVFETLVVFGERRVVVLQPEEGAIFHLLFVFGIPKEKIAHGG